jgi:CBS domain-containing protein
MTESKMPRTIKSIIEDQPPITCSPKTVVADAARLMRQHDIGALMVVDDGDLVGIFTERDALFRVIAEGRDPKTIRVQAVMTRDPETIHPDRPFADALQLMHTSGFRHVPVVENGRAIGMVSARDALGPELEDFIYELLRQEKINDIRG